MGSILALDIGERRIGVALANSFSRLPRPLTTLEVSNSIMDQLQNLLSTYQVTNLVIGLPRNLNGQETDQTRLVRQFAAKLAKLTTIPLSWQDEAVTSVQAEAELKSRGKAYHKQDIDALAATYILEDYLASNSEKVTS